jgi:predicted DNA-binding transcriptional regulator AlpA
MDRTLSRKQAVNVLGITDAEFALRMVWDAQFPKPIQDGSFRAANIVAWMDAQKGARPARLGTFRLKVSKAPALGASCSPKVFGCVC